jgi:hypothetical protein
VTAVNTIPRGDVTCDCGGELFRAEAHSRPGVGSCRPHNLVFLRFVPGPSDKLCDEIAVPERPLTNAANERVKVRAAVASGQQKEQAEAIRRGFSGSGRPYQQVTHIGVSFCPQVKSANTGNVFSPFWRGKEHGR